ncbi:ABC transporter ATP-binding protein [Corynebacterium lizhenjunii]|uniref:ABC transporter ATP-binding protein n=1 Tax=Corynebacterium lizhenjunii TaxID=2709394 RepID=A0A7T0KE94_9CORY|nr:ABC transporter ATP-binding protein [Corynebacterium lizhenjunii]QPK79190.1 ABC transporter ATP-binding protein [Corynebacterium lizhenjunii]
MATTHSDALAPASALDSWRYLKTLPSAPRRGWVWALVAVFAGTIVMMNLGSNVLGRIVDLVNGLELPVLGGGHSGMVRALVVVAVALLAEALGRALGGYMIQARTRRLAMDLRTAALDSVLRAPVPKIMELGTGNVITRLSKDIDNAVNAVSMMGERMAITLFILPITAVTMLLIHPLYAIIFVVAGVVMYPFIKGTVRDIPAVANMVSTSEATRNNVLLDTIRSLETLRRFSLADWATKRMERTSWQTVQAWADKVPLINRIIGQGTFAFGILLLGSLLLSVPMVQAEWITAGQASAAVLLVVRLEVHVFNVLFFAGEIQYAVTSLGRAVSLATLADDAATYAGSHTAALAGSPAITIEALSYSYPGGEPVLRHIDLELAAGTTTALVGTSGAGKSTLAALVAGLQYPSAGRIRVGDVDTSTVPNTWITEHVALVTQEVHLFSGSLRDDLLMAAPQASDAQLLAALAEVGLEPDTALWDRWLPQGLDTLIGAGNEEVGAEVAQQISLARMVLRQPPVLIMDEATSEAGSEHATVLEHAARTVAKGRTTLVVAHRLDQAREADRIIVMDHGEIVEDGTHATLLAEGGRYARAYRQWERGSATA